MVDALDPFRGIRGFQDEPFGLVALRSGGGVVADLQ
jgi:hypothetical protein